MKNQAYNIISKQNQKSDTRVGVRIKYIVNVRIPTPRAQGYAIMKMCEQFSLAGASVDLIIPRRGNSNDKDDPFEYYGIKKNFDIFRVSCSDLLGRTLKFGQLFYWIDLISFLFSLRLQGLTGSDDIIYTRDFLVPLIFSRKRSIYLELHEIPNSRHLFKYLIKKPKSFFVLNKNIKKILVDMGISSDKIFIFPSGVDLNEFDINLSKEDARKKVDLPLDKKIILYTGHLYPWKGVDTIAEVAKSMENTLFVFVGGIDPEFSQFVSKYKEYKNIIVRPFVRRGIIPVYLKSSDILIIPNSAKNQISREFTSPIKLFEYMASKKPIIASDLSSMREVLDMTNCLFAKPDNIQSFIDAINKVINSPELRDKITKQALNDVQKYSWQNRAKNILSLINHRIIP